MRNKRPQVTTAVLSNGMRAVHLGCARSGVEICGVCVRAGSRDERSDEYGLAHFVEHTIFKGTQKRRSSHIINRMEAVGGELNAYTTKEETVIYSIFPSGYLARAAELIGDLTANSQFPDSELDKEREVVADEIDSYLDTPSEAVFDDFEDMLFAGSPLGHNILGTADSLKSFDSRSCSNFVSRNYSGGNMVAFYSGARNPDAVFGVLDRYYSVIPQTETAVVATTAPKFNDPFSRHTIIASHQSHSVIGARVGSYMSPDRYATALLVNIMGGPGMNSLLNVELRERRGLVYSVEASATLYSDCGLLSVYYGCDPGDNMRCRQLVADTFAGLDRHLSPKKLEAAKKQYLGQLIISAENRENSVLAVARSLLWRNEVIAPEITEAAIRDLTAADILTAAEPMMRPSVLTFSPE